MTDNGYFKWDDPKITSLAGFTLPEGWWSRGYEYTWAMQYAQAGQSVADNGPVKYIPREPGQYGVRPEEHGAQLRVADMGCGWTPRPFKDALASVCAQTYAVDGNDKILGFPSTERLSYVVADFTQAVKEIPAGSLDRVFCISVLEDVADKVPLALQEFNRLLKPGGLCVLTFDVQYDMDKPLGQYPGVKIGKFWGAALDAGMWTREEMDIEKGGAVYNEDFNLCCYHCVLEKVAE